MLKMIILPRQARDKHRESTQKETRVFLQIREPLHPLLGAMKQTNVMMAVQAAQEYTGQQIHAVNLITMWEEYLLRPILV